MARLACEAIAGLVNENVLPEGREKFFVRVCQRILRDRGGELKANESFQHVRILEFLRRVFVNRLPEYAEQYRAQGKAAVAQVMETLAD